MGADALHQSKVGNKSLGRLRRLVLLGAVLLPIILGAMLVLALRPTRVGDGMEYLLTTVAFGETHQPFITQRVIDEYNELLRREPVKDAFPVSVQSFPFYGATYPNQCRTNI